MPSTRTVIALVALLALAGCSGLAGPDGTSPTAGEPTTEPGEPGPSPSTAPPSGVVEYGDLPPETRRTFRSAVENGSVRRDASAFEGLDPQEDEYVRYDGTTYALDWQGTYLRAEYGLDSVERVNGTPKGSDASVVAYANLSATGKRLFDRAMNGSGSGAYGPDEFPDAFLEYRYVEYRGRHYRPLVVHADIPQYELRVQEVDGEAGR
jgi:hypothetical protein